MISLLFPQQLAAIANHLWQSTLFAGVAGLLAMSLRGYRARFRHALWFFASLKFLIPFAALTTVGGYLPKASPQPFVASSPLAAIGQPFDTPPVFTLPKGPALPPQASPNAAVILGFFLWLAGFLSVAGYWMIRWRQVAACVRRAKRLSGREVPVFVSGEFPEPAAFGILHPAVLLPASILHSISGTQLDGVIAHEVCHIRRRDNLWSAMHMTVEALFWFHPLVWWLGARMLEDREFACDEAVLEAGCDPEAYAESLLQVCRHYLSRSPAFVSCAAASDLKRRMAGIMTYDHLRNLNRLQKTLLTALGIIIIAAPIAGGLAAARPEQAQEQQPAGVLRFEEASIKPNNPKDPRVGAFPSSGRLVIHNFTLKRLILMAYKLKDFQLDGAKGWMDADAWDIEGIFPAIPGKSNMHAGADRLPALLADRFHLAVHRETRQLPVYTLVTAKGGPKLTPSDPNDGKAQSLRVLPRKDPAGFTYIKMSFNFLPNLLGGELNLPIVDKTGITGIYDVTLSYTPQQLLDTPDYAGGGISVFTALQQQLGLKLEESKGPVEVVVVDHAEKPSAN